MLVTVAAGAVAYRERTFAVRSAELAGSGRDGMNASAYVLLEDGTRFDGDACAASGPDVWVTGEVVFTTGMSGYQESVTDPSFAQPDHHLHAPARRQLRRSAVAMESDRVHAAP